MKPNSLFFLGIDSATWDLIKPWVKAGRLPGFARLLKTGLALNLESTVPPLTPIAWTSLYTGVNAGKHNVFDFYRFDKNKQITVNLADSNQMPTIFEMLSRQQKKIAVLNLPFTYPLRPVKGLFLSGFLTPNLEADFIYPRDLQSEFKNRFPDYSFTEKVRYGMDQASQTAYFHELIKSIRQKIKVFDWAESKADWDLFAVNFMEVDHVQHWFFHQPEKMLKVYRQIDRYLLTKLEQNRFAQYLVFSDHGAGPYLKNLNLNTYFLKQGLLVLKTDFKTRAKKMLFDLGVTPSNVAKLALKLNKLPSSSKGRGKAQKIKLFLELSDIDWQKSLAFAFGYYGNIYLIKKDQKSQQLVRTALNKLSDHGQPVIDQIWEKKAVYHGPYSKYGPDLLYSAGQYAYGASAISPFLDNQVFSTPHTLKSGEHRPLGILALANKVKLVKKRTNINIYETSATLLNLLGVSVPDYFEGKSIINNHTQNLLNQI